MQARRANKMLHRLLFCGITAILFTSPCMADSYLVYIKDESQRAEAEKLVKAALPENADLQVTVLPTECHTRAEAQVQAEALYAGVMALPCLVVSDEKGPYAVLPVDGITAEKIQEVQPQAQHPERKARADERDLSARIYLLCATLCVEEIDDATLSKVVAECRQLIEHPHATTEQQQFIGYRCLYPALLLQYSRGYTGAHTPYTEAKLLEAIAALEAARDLDRESKIGKQAFDERERLRRARREARKYE